MMAEVGRPGAGVVHLGGGGGGAPEAAAAGLERVLVQLDRARKVALGEARVALAFCLLHNRRGVAHLRVCRN